VCLLCPQDPGLLDLLQRKALSRMLQHMQAQEAQERAAAATQQGGAVQRQGLVSPSAATVSHVRIVSSSVPASFAGRSVDAVRVGTHIGYLCRAIGMSCHGHRRQLRQRVASAVRCVSTYLHALAGRAVAVLCVAHTCRRGS
jgi:hypothetical protein